MPAAAALLLSQQTLQQGALLLGAGALASGSTAHLVRNLPSLMPLPPQPTGWAEPVPRRSDGTLMPALGGSHRPLTLQEQADQAPLGQLNRAVSGALEQIQWPTIPQEIPNAFNEALRWGFTTAQAAAAKLWAWMNRPSSPTPARPMPGLTEGVKVEIITSPRLSTYGCWFTGEYWDAVKPGWVYGSRGPGFAGPNAQQNFTNSYVSITATPAETNKGMLYGKEVCHASLLMTGVTTTGAVHTWTWWAQFVVGKWSVKLWPGESDETGWNTSTNAVTAPPWTTALPAREPAAAPILPPVAGGLARFVPSAVPGMPKELEEALGEKAKAPPWTWPDGPGVAEESTPAKEKAVESQTAGRKVVIPRVIEFPTAPEVGQKVGTDGKLIPLPLPRVEPTEETAHVVNGRKVVAPDVRPDLVSIAREVGRIERKTAGLLDHDNGLTPIDWTQVLGESGETLGRLWDLLNQEVPAWEYEIEAPCDKGADGQPLKIQYKAPAEDYLESSHRKLDLLLQLTKETISWRRHVCKGGKRNLITITARSIEPD